MEKFNYEKSGISISICEKKVHFENCELFIDGKKMYDLLCIFFWRVNKRKKTPTLSALNMLFIY